MEIKEVTKDNPCQHCNKPDWCYRLSNGLEVCNRDNIADGWKASKKRDRNNQPYLFLEETQKTAKVVKTTKWFYPDRQGQPLIMVKRLDYSDRSKKPYQLHWAGKRWVNSYGPVLKEDIPIYNYRNVRQAIASGELVFFVEGEKCVDALTKLGFVATTNIAGWSNWHDGLAKDLEGASLVLCPDRDKCGLNLMARIYKHFPNAQWLYADPSSKFWQPNLIPPDHGYDVADWCEDAKVDQKLILDTIEPCRTEILTQEKNGTGDIDVDLHYTEKAIASLYSNGHYKAIEDCLYRFNGKYYEKCCLGVTLTRVRIPPSPFSLVSTNGTKV